MSTNISGRGKQRKHGHDLNTNSMSMGGGQTAMPPNGAAAAPFGLPIVPVNHAPPNQQDYAPRQQYGGSNLDYSAASGHQHVPSMALPNGTNIQQTETSPYAMHGPPQPNMQQRPGMQQQQQQPWMTQQQQQQHQQQQMMQHGGVANNRVLAPQPTNPRSYQQQPQPMVPYPVAYSGGQPGFAYMGNLYPGQVYPQEYGYMVAPQPQQFYQPTHHPMMAQQQQQQQHQQQMQAVPPPQSQQAGGATGGVGAGGQMSGVPTSQPTPMHGGAQSGAPIHQGTAPATAPAVAPVPSYNPTMQQPRPSAPPAVPKQKKILAIVNPETKETMNQKDVEASLREEDAPKAEKEEAKGTDETDSAAPEVKKQFANAILEQTTKSEKPAPAPASAPPPKPVNKCLFSPDQLVGLKISLKDKASQVPAHPVVVPPAPVAAPVAAAPAAEQPVSEEEAPVKQSTPEVVPTEMPATSNDEQADESQLAEVSVHEEPNNTMGRGGAFHRKKNKGAVAAAAVAAPSTSDTVVLDHKPWYQSGPLSPFYLLWSALWLRALWLVRLIRGQKEAITIETQAVTVSTQLSCTRDEPESVESVHNDEPIPSASESAPVVREEPVEIVEDEQEAGPSTAASVQDQDEDEDETEEYEEDRQSTSSEEQAPVVRKEARVEYVNQYPVVSSMDEPDYPEERYGGCSVELHRTSIEEVDEEDIDDESEDLGRSSSLSCCGPEDEDEDYDCASSSSEKNASNDSAICVQSPVAQPTPVEEEKVVVVEEPTPVAADEAAVEDVVQEREEKEEEEADQPADVEEPLVKKLEQLVIEESVSQEEAESEPSTPAPVTPSVSETAANLAEEEEDAEKAEEERLQKMEEERQKRRADLEAAIAQNMEDIDQVNEEIGRYNREYLYNVRDLEKYFHVTPCPLTPDELKNFGICRSLVSNEPRKKQDGQGGFMPGWARSGGGGGRGGGPKPYTGRQSEQHQRGGGGRHGSNKKLPPSIRPSIERRVETNVQLHKAEKAWKPEKVTDAADLEDEEVKKKLLLKTIRALFNKITPTTKEALINEFLDHKVYQSPALNEVISVIFDKAVEEPKFCPLYSNMCNTQVAEELKLNNNVSLFRNAILVRAQETFTTKNLDDYVAEKQAEIEAETDEKKKKEKQIELLETQSKFRRRKFGNITFIGQLYLQGLISIRIIHFCVVDLLKSVAKTAEPVEPDEESIDCAVRLLETIGKRLHEESVRANKEAANAAAAAKNAPKVIQRGAPVPKPQSAPTQQFPLELTFQTLEGATSNVSSRIKFMIMNLVELRRNGWVPRKGADAGPKKLDEIKKDIQKEQMENQHQQQMYERKQSRQEPMGGRGMGGGGGHGGHGGNPKRQVIQRNSTDRGNIEERRAQAYKSSNLPPSKAPAKKASLSTVTATEKTSLGGGAKKWSHGASGGSENSKKEERAGAIQQTSRFMQQRSSSAASMKEDEGAGASGNATQVNSEDEREANELREKQEADIAKRVVCDVGDYGTGEITLEEVREEVFKIVGQEKFGSPSLQLVFKCFMTAAVKKVTTASETGPKFGHVLAFCLLKKADEKDTKSRDEMLKGVADSCREVVEQEQWEDAPKIWDIFAEVLINAHVAEEGLFEGAHPTLNDFKDAFLHAAKDTRKPYTLFVLVLKRLAEFHHKRDKDAVMEVMSWVLDECETIVKKMDKKKLDKALEDTTTNFDGNLHKIMNENRH